MKKKIIHTLVYTYENHVSLEDHLIKKGLHEAIDNLQIDLNKLHDLIHGIYFTNDKRFDIESLQE